VQSFSSNGGIVSALLLAETFVLILVLLQLPKLLMLPFYPSYAAFTFPFVVTATAYFFGVQSLVEAGFISAGWYVVPAVVILFAAVLVVYVFVRYVREVCKAVSIS
jgi:exfoliative toxin A/B